MSTEQGFVGDDGECFESRLCRLMEYQTKQTQQQLEKYQEQYQRQLGELTASISQLIQTLEIKAKFVGNIGTDDNRVKLEVNSGQNSVDAVPSLPQPDCIGTPPANEREPGYQDRYRNNQSTRPEIKEEINEEGTDPCLLEQGMPCVDHQPQQPRLSDFTGIPSVDYPTIQLNSSKRNFYLPGCLPLYNFSRKGKWEKAKVLLTKQPELLKLEITTASDTVLLIAAKNKQWMFVEELLKIMPPEALESKDNVQGNTALHIAAREGNKNVAKAIVDKNRNVTQIRDKDQKVPLLTAALFASPGQKDTLEYLCTVTENKDPSPFAGPDGASLICNILDAHYYDIALYLFQRYPNLVLEKTKNSRMWPLEVISQRPFAFRSENELKWRERCIYSLIQIDTTSLGRYHGSTTGDVENPSLWSHDVHMRDRGIISKFFSRFITHFAPHVPSMERIYKLKLMHEQAAALVKGLICHLRITKTTIEVSNFFKNSQVLQTAIKFGTNELVEECLTHFPDLNWANMNNKRLIQISIEERNETILKLICKTSKEYKNQLVSNIDLSGNSILHYAAKLAPLPQLTSVSGAALQMQREMQWFKGVQNLVDERNRHVRNKAGKSAQFIFTQEHNELRKEGEQWMKDTSQSCMLVATLIATVVFAAAFTVPGGNLSNDNNEYKAGTPIFLYENSFMLFAVADSLALFSSITSILMFLAILTSRYAEEDFLTSLPKKLIIGLGTLFFSIATTMIAFGAALFIVLGSRFAWVPIPIALCAFVPVSLFARLQFPLFVEMVRSTYWPTIFRFD